MGNKRYLGLKRLLVSLLFLVIVSLPTLSLGETFNLKEYFPLHKGFRLYKTIGVEEQEAESEFAIEGQLNGKECMRVFTRSGEECEYGGWYEDGLRLYRWESMVSEGEYEIYEPYVLICPVQMEIGERFTSLCSYKCYDEGGMLAHQGPLSIELQALGEEEVTVTAGTFNCLKIHGKVQWTPSDEEKTHIWEADIWLAQGIGLIKMDLIDLTPGEEEVPRIYKLTYGSSLLPGDVDDDGHVTIDEVQKVINAFLGIHQ